MAEVGAAIMGAAGAEGPPQPVAAGAAAAGHGLPEQPAREDGQEQQGHRDVPPPVGAAGAPEGGGAGADDEEEGYGYQEHGGDGGGHPPVQYNEPAYMPGHQDLAITMRNGSIGAFVVYSGVLITDFDQIFAAAGMINISSSMATGIVVALGSSIPVRYQILHPVVFLETFVSSPRALTNSVV